MRKVLLLLFFCSIFSGISAQQDEGLLRILAFNTSDSVILRWAPVKHLQWSRLNRYGYRLERFVLDKDSKPRKKGDQIGPDTIRPWPVEQWKQGLRPDNKFAPVALQAVHGKTFAASDFKSESAMIRAKSQEGEMRFAFSLYAADMDAQVADALGLRWVDKGIASNKQVLYRLISLDPEFPDTALVGINRAEKDILPPAPDAPEAEEMEGRIKLRWNTYPESPVFTAFILERSDDKQNWKAVSDLPLVKADPPQALYNEPYLYYTDTTIAKNYKPYFYRVRGISPFALLSEPSAEISAMGRDKTAPPNPELGNVSAKDGKIILSWNYPQTPSDLSGFLVARAAEQNGEYKFLTTSPLMPSARSYTDSSPDVMGENYYVVYAKDTAGNISASMPAYGFLPDSIAPGKPLKPSGSIDTNGVVTLHWKLGPEPDIQGYRVYFANAADHEFSIKTPKPLRDTVFRDTITLNTLTKKIYYKIAAVDRNYNHSEVSEILVLQKPDILPPVESLFADFSVSDTAVVLKMIPSSSKDVKEHVLYKRESGTEKWNKLITWPRGRMPESFTDKSVNGATYYQYTLVATDSSGNNSPFSPTADVRVMPKVSKMQLENLKLTYDAAKHEVKMTWNKPATEVKYYVIYRGKDGKRPSVLTSPAGSENSFSEVLLPGKSRYKYLIKAIYSDGGESPIMNAGEVERK
ncbi:MAG: hypothetical protein R2850_09040 [Bacteroidia bacterium]